MHSPYSLRKAKEKQNKNKEKKRKKKKKRKKVKRWERKERKTFVWAPMPEKSILCDLVKTYLLIPLFTN